LATIAVAAIGILVAACGSTAAPGWTYDPSIVAPSPAASAGASEDASPSASGSPAG
jgi:hypothetical protein